MQKSNNGNTFELFLMQIDLFPGNPTFPIREYVKDLGAFDAKEHLLMQKMYVDASIGIFPQLLTEKQYIVGMELGRAYLEGYTKAEDQNVKLIEKPTDKQLYDMQLDHNLGLGNLSQAEKDRRRRYTSRNTYNNYSFGTKPRYYY